MTALAGRDTHTGVVAGFAAHLRASSWPASGSCRLGQGFWRGLSFWGREAFAALPSAEVRFPPAGGIRPHEVEAQRGLAGLLLQNAVIVHRGPGVLELDSASLEVLAAGRVVATREYGRADLEKAAKRGCLGPTGKDSCNPATSW